MLDEAETDVLAYMAFGLRKNPAHKADAAFARAFRAARDSLSARGRGGEGQRTDQAAKESRALAPHR